MSDSAHVFTLGIEEDVATRSLIDEILEFIAPEAIELGSEREMAHIQRIMREGTGADRQLAAWEARHEVKDVVDQILRETYQGLEIDREKDQPFAVWFDKTARAFLSRPGGKSPHYRRTDERERTSPDLDHHRPIWAPVARVV